MCAPVSVTVSGGASVAGAILMSQIIALLVLVGILIANYKEEIKRMIRA